MDDQHGILVDAVNELRLAVVRGASHEVVRGLVERLVEFTAMHFKSEERLMEQWAFPDLAEHRVEHQRLLRQLGEKAHGFDSKGGFEVEFLLSLLCETFTAHIRERDQQYGLWLNACGIH